MNFAVVQRREAARESPAQADFSQVAAIADEVREPTISAGQSGFLQVPPFPGAKAVAFHCARAGTADSSTIIAALRRNQVGGTYWAGAPDLPARSVVVCSPNAINDAKAYYPASPIVGWFESVANSTDADLLIQAPADPWGVLDGAEALVAAKADPLCLIAAILGIQVSLVKDEGGIEADGRTVDELLIEFLPANESFFCPFSGAPLSQVDAIDLCGFWRRLIESNRGISGGFGFAFWKKGNVEPLLWDGTHPFKFLTSAMDVPAGSTVALWRTRTPHSVVESLMAAGTSLVEVEDGFLRSRGLGADCVPPLSIVVDRLGPHFDPGQRSELELLLEGGTFDDDLLERAALLRRTIVEAGLGKYETGGTSIGRFDGERRHILVPGQVEDDRSILTGGAGLRSNAELLARVRERAPDAYILFKPHPDVVAGHRKGAVPQAEVLKYADRIVSDHPISTLLDMVDEVHVNTSLTGFEALLRGKPVTTHGIPFYAGWGLTTDLAAVPGRRTARRSIDELVAATLLLYPRYIDPITGLPCPAEIAVQRLTERNDQRADWFVTLRRIQGKLMRRVRSWGR